MTRTAEQVLGQLRALTRAERLNVVERIVQEVAAAFDGRTPDEVYFGDRPELEQELIEARHRARAKRLAANRALVYNSCVGQGPPSKAVSQEVA